MHKAGLRKYIKLKVDFKDPALIVEITIPLSHFPLFLPRLHCKGKGIQASYKAFLVIVRYGRAGGRADAGYFEIVKTFHNLQINP